MVEAGQQFETGEDLEQTETDPPLFVPEGTTQQQESAHVAAGEATLAAKIGELREDESKREVWRLVIDQDGKVLELRNVACTEDGKRTIESGQQQSIKDDEKQSQMALEFVRGLRETKVSTYVHESDDHKGTISAWKSEYTLDNGLTVIEWEVRSYESLRTEDADTDYLLLTGEEQASSGNGQSEPLSLSAADQGGLPTETAPERHHDRGNTTEGVFTEPDVSGISNETLSQDNVERRFRRGRQQFVPQRPLASVWQPIGRESSVTPSGSELFLPAETVSVWSSGDGYDKLWQYTPPEAVPGVTPANLETPVVPAELRETLERSDVPPLEETLSLSDSSVDSHIPDVERVAVTMMPEAPADARSYEPRDYTTDTESLSVQTGNVLPESPPYVRPDHSQTAAELFTLQTTVEHETAAQREDVALKPHQSRAESVSIPTAESTLCVLQPQAETAAVVGGYPVHESSVAEPVREQQVYIDSKQREQTSELPVQALDQQLSHASAEREITHSFEMDTSHLRDGAASLEQIDSSALKQTESEVRLFARDESVQVVSAEAREYQAMSKEATPLLAESSATDADRRNVESSDRVRRESVLTYDEIEQMERMQEPTLAEIVATVTTDPEAPPTREVSQNDSSQRRELHKEDVVAADRKPHTAVRESLTQSRLVDVKLGQQSLRELMIDVSDVADQLSKLTETTSAEVVLPGEVTSDGRTLDATIIRTTEQGRTTYEFRQRPQREAQLALSEPRELNNYEWRADDLSLPDQAVAGDHNKERAAEQGMTVVLDSRVETRAATDVRQTDIARRSRHLTAPEMIAPVVVSAVELEPPHRGDGLQSSDEERDERIVPRSRRRETEKAHTLAA